MTATFASSVANEAPNYNPWDKAEGNADNEFANTVFLNIHSYLKNFPNSPDEYPRYVSYQLGIHDPVKKFIELLNDGFLIRATESEVLNNFKVAELKEILEIHNIQCKGKKAELIETIIESISIDDLNLPEMYVVSAKGKDYISVHEDMLQLSRNQYNI